MALNAGLRSCASKMLRSSGSLVPKPVSREIHSTGMKRMGGHGHGDEPEYMHSYHMYNLDKMKYRNIKMPLAVWSCFFFGFGVPIYAVIFQQRKASAN